MAQVIHDRNSGAKKTSKSRGLFTAATMSRVTAESLRIPGLTDAVVESQLERLSTIGRARLNLRAAMAIEREAHTQEERQHARMPKVWTTESNVIAIATGITSTHSEVPIDQDAVDEMLDGNLMGLNRVIDPVANDTYLDELTAEKPEAPRSTEAPSPGTRDAEEHSKIVDGLARSTVDARAFFERQV